MTLPNQLTQDAQNNSALRNCSWIILRDDICGNCASCCKYTTEREKINKLNKHALQTHFLLIPITQWLWCNLLQIKIYCCKANYITHNAKKFKGTIFLISRNICHYEKKKFRKLQVSFIQHIMPISGYVSRIILLLLRQAISDKVIINL